MTTTAMATLPTLLLADGRFPAGGHAHSAGVEAACADGRITDESSLQEFVEGRVRTAGLVDASLAAATVLLLSQVTADRRVAILALDAEAEARITAPPLRAASRRLGRQLVRVGRRCWPHETLIWMADSLPTGVHQTVALGVVGLAAGCDPAAVARLVIHHTLTTPAQAAVRLLGLDPFAVAAVTADLGSLGEQVIADAVAAARRAVPTAAQRQDVAHSASGRLSAAGWASALAELPAFTSPLVEIAAVEHAAWKVRMFAT